MILCAAELAKITELANIRIRKEIEAFENQVIEDLCKRAKGIAEQGGTSAILRIGLFDSSNSSCRAAQEQKIRKEICKKLKDLGFQSTYWTSDTDIQIKWPKTVEEACAQCPNN